MCSSTSEFLCKMLSSLLHCEKPCILVFIYFGLWRVSLAEYLFVLRLYFSHVADGIVYHGYCKNCFSPAVDEEWDHGHGPSILVCSGCFCWTWSWNWHVSKLCVWDILKLCCFRYWIWTSCCNNYIWTPMYVELLANFYITCDMCVESYTILVCMLVMNRGHSRHSTDYRVQNGSSMIVWHPDGCYCTCALINWSVLW